MYIRAGQFKHNWFIHSLTEALQKFYVDYKAGKRPILIISCPPQHGKTWAIEDLISWMAGQDPDCRMVYASFSDYLGKRCNSANQRVFDSEKYKKIFPKTWVSPKDCDEVIRGTYMKNSNLVEFINRQGSLRNTTVGGPITGESLDCVSGETKIIILVNGLIRRIRIKDLILIDSPVKVLSYNHKTGEVEFEEIKSIKKITKNGILRITDNNGRVLECTPDHDIFTEKRGYIPADSLSSGEDNLLVLRDRGCKKGVRHKQVDQDELPTHLLFEKMPEQSPGDNQKSCKILQRLWERVTETVGRSLWRVSCRSKKGSNNRKNTLLGKEKLQVLWRNVPGGTQGKRSFGNLLFKKMFGKGTLYSDEWRRKRDVERGNERTQGIARKHPGFLQREKSLFAKQFKALQSLWACGKTSFPPHRRGPIKQRRFKHKTFMRVSPFTNSSGIKKTEKVNEEMEFFDITVRNNHNFFANDILVHNCGFVDDAFKGRQEANSPVTRETVWNWFTDDFGTRFSDPAGYIITMTRWHVDDIVGRLLAKLDDPDRVTVFKYAAIAEEDEQFRKKGEALFPELKSLEFLLGKKAIMLDQAWQSLYQGSPIAVGGNLIDERWWQWWERLPLMKFTYAVADTAQKTNNWNDYTVFQLWGMGVDGNIYLLDMFYDRVKAPDLRRQAEIFYRSADNTRFGGPFRGFLIEDKSSGTGLIQELEEKKFKVIPIPRTTDKVTRAFDTGPEIRAGKVFLNAAIPHVNVITTESGIFPNGANDDAFDCTMNGIEVAYIYPELLNNTIFVG
jgi:predicted phage terminase large subunit-like protein